VRRPTLVLSVAALAVLAAMVAPNGWVQQHLALRFAVVFGFVVAGLPFLFVLVRANSPAALPSRSGRSRRGARPRADGVPAPIVGDPKRWGRVRLAAVFGAGAALWALLSALLSARPAVSTLGLYSEATGALFVCALVGAWAVGMGAGQSAASLIEDVLVVAAGLSAALALVQTAVDLSGIGLGTLSSRSTGLWGNPVFLGAFLVGCFWVVVHRVGREPRMWSPLAALVAAGVEVSGSRFAIALLVVAVVAGAVTVGRGPALALVVAVIVGIGAGAALAHAGNQQTSSARVASGTADGLRPRLETWIAAPREIARHPLVGVGPGRFRAASGPRRTLALARTEGPDRVFDDAHDIVVEYAVTTGLPGMVAVIGFLILAVLLAGWRSPLGGFGVLILVMHLVQPLHSCLTPLALLALGVAGGAHRQLPSRLPAAAWTVMGTVATVAAAVLTVGSVRMASGVNTLAAERANATAARKLLGWWSEPYTYSAAVELLAVQADPSVVITATQFRAAAAAREPDDPLAWGNLATLEETRGLTALAERDYRQALLDNPWSVAVLDRLGPLLAKEGRKAEAAAVWRRSLRVEPDQPAVLQQLS